MAGNNGVGHVKVVIINTQYVETDAVSFKSVVQRLTGKDATVAEDHRPASTTNTNGPELGRGMSFKDFDLMLKDLPSFDELIRLFPDY